MKSGCLAHKRQPREQYQKRAQGAVTTAHVGDGTSTRVALPRPSVGNESQAATFVEKVSSNQFGDQLSGNRNRNRNSREPEEEKLVSTCTRISNHTAACLE